MSEQQPVVLGTIYGAEVYDEAYPVPVPQFWYALRAPTPEELPAVYEAWAGTFKRSRSAGCIPNHMFNEVTYAAITQLLQRGMQIRVLVDRGAPSVTLGWVAFELDRRHHDASPTMPIVHYLFVRDGLRQRGYGQLLLDAIGAGTEFIYTHQTPFAKYWPRAKHNPGIARRKQL